MTSWGKIGRAGVYHRLDLEEPDRVVTRCGLERSRVVGFTRTSPVEGRGCRPCLSKS